MNKIIHYKLKIFDHEQQNNGEKGSGEAKRSQENTDIKLLHSSQDQQDLPEFEHCIWFRCSIKKIPENKLFMYLLANSVMQYHNKSSFNIGKTKI